MRSSSLALAVARPARPRQRAAVQDELAGLRRRLATYTTREAVLADLAEDDLSEARQALDALCGWMQALGGALRDPGSTRHALLALALAEEPLEDVAYLEATLLSLRRRLGAVASRLPGPAAAR
jgi:hypothetical protein